MAPGSNDSLGALLAGLGVTLPVLSAPMAGGPGTPELVVAAARAGGFGFLAGGYLGAETLAAQLREVGDAGVSFGVNLFAPKLVPVERAEFDRYRHEVQLEADGYGLELGAEPREDDDDWQRKLELLLDRPVPLVSFTFAIPAEEELAELRRAGSYLVQTVTSPLEAQAASEAGVDALVVQAVAAGGHLGTLLPGVRPIGASLPELLVSVREVSDLPMIAAGGLCNAEGVAAAMRAGAEAVMVGTALLLADESGTSDVHRAALRDPARTVTAMTRAFTGRPARGLHNGFMERHRRAPLGYPAIHHLTAPLRRAAAAAGDAERVNLWAGTGFRDAQEGSTASILAQLAGSL